MRALLIADDLEERDFLSYALRYIGLETIKVTEPVAAMTDPMENPYDVIILCVSAEEGLPIARKIRETRQTPLHLIADSLTEQLHADFLDEGVDCVLQRPVSLKLFTRYTNMLLKRSGSVPVTLLATLRADPVALDPSTRTVSVNGGEPEQLTQLEFRLLYVLMTNAAQIVPTDELVERVWGYAGDGNRDLVRGLVRRLRRKVEPTPESPQFIHNLPGVGYRFEVT
jgi:DNA-binding response OmpR family regulator